ncbi:unnamed protein product [Sympodiomycopsis kandeliae]
MSPSKSMETVHERDRHGEPINAEPDPGELTTSIITPQARLYRRNHGEIVNVSLQSDNKWVLTLTVDDDIALDGPWSHRPVHRKVEMPLARLKSDWPLRSVTAAMECAGNRRSDMRNNRRGTETEGLQWNQAAIGNATWHGVAVREFALSLGIPDPYGHLEPSRLKTLPPTDASMQQESAQWARDLHMHFISSQSLSQPQTQSSIDKGDQAEDPQQQLFGSSVPLTTALHPNADLLLSHSVNSPTESLECAHGYPLRVVIPDHLGARWTKWLKYVRISRQPNRSPSMQDDYKMLVPPQGDSSEVESQHWIESISGPHKDLSKRERLVRQEQPMARLGIGSAVTLPLPASRVPIDQGCMRVEGYAVGSEGSPISLVEISLIKDPGPETSLDALRKTADEGASWHKLELGETVPAAEASQSKECPSSCQETSTAACAGEPDWSWSLWQAHLRLESAHKSGRWCIVARATTSSGQLQEMESPWNVRGFGERSWPVVRNLEIAE